MMFFIYITSYHKAVLMPNRIFFSHTIGHDIV